MRLRNLAAVALVPLAAASLAACGGSGESGAAAATSYAKTAPKTIDQDARTAMAAMKSVHVKANITDSGNVVAMDMSLDTSGSCTGTITTKGYTFGLVVTSGKSFMKASKAFWTSQGAPSAVLSKVADKWVTGFPQSEFADTCQLKSLISGITKDPISNDAPKVLGTDTVDGTSVVKLQVKGESGTNILYIAAQSPHNLVKAVSSDGKNTMDLSAFDQPVGATAPSGAVDLSTLQ